MLALTVLAAGCFCAAAVLIRWGPGWLASPPPWLTGAVALAAAAGAVLAHGAPTGLGVWDAVLRAAAAAVAVIACARAGRAVVWVATASTAAAAAVGSPVAWVAFAALGLASGPLAARRSAPALSAVVAGALTQVLLRLAWPGPSLASAVAAAVVLGVVVIPGFQTIRVDRAALPRRGVTTGLVVGGVAAVAAACALGGVAAARARQPLERGEAHARAGLAAGDTATGAAQLSAAGREFTVARDRLDAWWARPALAVPVVGIQLRALRVASDSGAQLAVTGTAVLRQVAGESLRVQGGVVPVSTLTGLERPLVRASTSLATAAAHLQQVSSPWLIAPLGRRFDELRRRVDQARHGAQVGVLAARAAPALFGADTPRRYFLAIETPAESRAGGGIIGNFGQISAERGRLRLDRLGRSADLNFVGDPAARRLSGPPDYVARYARFEPAQIWQNIPVSPDFPTVGEVVSQLYPQSGGTTVDGVISVDPIGLAGILELVGPVQVPGWPEPITSANAVRILLHDEYVRFGDTPARESFLGTVASAVWSRLTASGLPGPAAVARALGPAVRTKHLLLWSREPQVEALFEAMGVGGRMPPATPDSLAVVTQNAGGNKIDWYLHRSVDYQVDVRPGTAGVRASLTIRLRNDAPAGGLPDYVIGNVDGVTPTGANHTLLSVYTPWALSPGGASLNGSPLVMEQGTEAGRRVYSADVTIGSGSTSVVHLDLVGGLPAGAEAYRLNVDAQPTIVPDQLRASVRIGGTWAAADANGWTSSGSCRADLVDSAGGDRQAWFSLEPAGLLALPWGRGTG